MLGPAGMGLNTLFSSSISMIGNISGLGLNFSAVRDLSKANESGNKLELSKTVGIFKWWLYGSSVLGVVAVIALSPVLSSYTFKSNDYILAFIFLSLMLLFNALASGNATILQGTRNLKYFAIYSVTSSLVALLVSVPLYYYYGIKGIVPALILSPFVTYLISLYYISKLKIKRVRMPAGEIYHKGLSMVKLGAAMMLATYIGSLVNYLLNTYIGTSGSYADLGFYQAGINITSQSIGLVFTAMAIDYYPKLSAISDDNFKVRDMVNQQGEVTMLIATPILIMLIVAMPLAIRILYTADFLPISNFIRLLSFGMFFKAASYSIGAISFAKGDKKVFFTLEGIYSNVSMLVLCAGGYSLYGLQGLAWAFLIMHALYFTIVSFVTYKLYNFIFSPGLKKILVVQFLFIATAVILFVFVAEIIAYPIAGLMLLFSILFSYKEIDKLIGIREFVLQKLGRISNPNPE